MSYSTPIDFIALTTSNALCRHCSALIGRVNICVKCDSIYKSAKYGFNGTLQVDFNNKQKSSYCIFFLFLFILYLPFFVVNKDVYITDLDQVKVM